MNISDPDLISVFGNILDNAAEACRGTENSVVTLKTEYRKPYLTISCRNPIQPEKNEKKQRIPGMERGVGLTILAHLADQYDGQLSCGTEDNTFFTAIILKAEETASV